MQFFRIVMAAPHSCIPFLYAIAEKGRKDKEGTDQEQARAHKRYDGLGNTVLARVHLYVNLESGHNHTNPGDGTTESLDVEHVLYFACNCTDNQNYVKSGKGKCSQNDTRIVLPMNEEKGCV